MERTALLAVALFGFVPLPYIDRGTTHTVNPITVLVVWAALAVPAALVLASSSGGGVMLRHASTTHGHGD